MLFHTILIFTYDFFILKFPVTAVCLIINIIWYAYLCVFSVRYFPKPFGIKTFTLVKQEWGRGGEEEKDSLSLQGKIKGSMFFTKRL